MTLSLLKRKLAEHSSQDCLLSLTTGILGQPYHGLLLLTERGPEVCGVRNLPRGTASE